MRAPVVASPTRFVRAKKCAWNRCCNKASLTHLRFCARHYKRAVQDYMNVTGVNPSKAVSALMTTTKLLRAMRICDARRAVALDRKRRLRRMCAATGCHHTDTPDSGYSCQACTSYIPATGAEACAFDGCDAGRLPRDKFCGWHMRTMFLVGHGQCYLCNVRCESGRFCPPCDMRCRYADTSTALGVCAQWRTIGSRFCHSHRTD